MDPSVKVHIELYGRECDKMESDSSCDEAELECGRDKMESNCPCDGKFDIWYTDNITRLIGNEFEQLKEVESGYDIDTDFKFMSRAINGIIVGRPELQFWEYNDIGEFISFLLIALIRRMREKEKIYIGLGKETC